MRSPFCALSVDLAHNESFLLTFNENRVMFYVFRCVYARY